MTNADVFESENHFSIRKNNKGVQKKVHIKFNDANEFQAIDH